MYSPEVRQSVTMVSWRGSRGAELLEFAAQEGESAHSGGQFTRVADSNVLSLTNNLKKVFTGQGLTPKVTGVYGRHLSTEILPDIPLNMLEGLLDASESLGGISEKGIQWSPTLLSLI